MKPILFIALFLSAGIVPEASPLQIFKTSLTLTVRDELGNTVEGADVKLFEKKDDYTKEQNQVEVGKTDKKGIVHFKKLKPIAYFILVRKGDKDNTSGGQETKLEDGKFNKVTIIIQ
jgi:hypothetical protein